MEKVVNMSMFKKTGLLAFCLFGVISILTSALAAYTLYDRMTKEYISKGSAIAQSIGRASQEIMLNRDATNVQALIDQYLEIEGVAYVFVMDAERTVISHTFVPQMPPRLSMLHDSKLRQIIAELDVESYGRVIDISEPIMAGVAGYVHVGMDKELIMDYFWSAVLKMQVLLVVIFWVCVAILFVVTRRISRPLAQLTEYAEKLAAQDFSAKINIRSKSEFGMLGKTMEDMAKKLSILFNDMESEVSKSTRELREHMVYLSAIIDNLADGLLVVSPTGNVSIINPAMREFFDLGDKDYRGFSATDVFPTEVSGMTTAIRICDKDLLAAEIPLSKGRTGKAVGSSIFIEEPSSQCLGGVLLVRDITREKELDQLKTDFISTVSHELRTPMTSVLGFSKIIKKKLEQAVFPSQVDKSDAEKSVSQIQDNMEIIVTEAERLTDLINDVLDIAKMEAGKIRWRDQVVFMDEVLKRGLDSTRGLWEAKGLVVIRNIEDDLPPVRGDYSRLVQVLVNLISNAVKFTNEGQILCSIHMEDSSVLVSVSDCGSGIAEDHMDIIFDKFKQAGDTLTEKPAGTGLGLPICRQIVEHHGGRIWAESEPGKGSTFLFSIPAANILVAEDADGDEDCRQAEVDPDRALGEVAGPATDPLILVVDEDPTLGRFMTQIFEKQGFGVKLAENGDQAEEMIRDQVPNLVTMDLMMPDMGGQQIIKSLRCNPATCHIPILVMSALLDAVSIGGDLALTKPVDGGRVVEVVCALLQGTEIRSSCLVLGDFDNYEYLTDLCSGKIEFCPLGDIWKHIRKGFKGILFISSELSPQIDISLLARLPEVALVLLPVCNSCKGSA